MALGLLANTDELTTRQIAAPVTGPPSDAAGPPTAAAILGSSSIQVTGSPQVISVGFLDTNSSHRLRFASAEDLTADRTLSLILSNANRQLTIGDTSAIDQDVRIAAAPRHARLGLGVAADATRPFSAEAATNDAGLFVDTTTSSSAQGAGLRLASNDGSANASGDRLGGLLFAGRDNSTLVNGAGIFGYADENWGAAARGSSIRFEVALIGATSRTELLRISSNGSVGLASATPNYAGFTRAFTVETSASGAFELASTRADADAALIGAVSANYRTNSTNHQRFAEIQFQSDGATANQRGGSVVLVTKANGSTTFSEKWRLSAAGNVTGQGTGQYARIGIGTAPDATALLKVGTALNGFLRAVSGVVDAVTFESGTFTPTFAYATPGSSSIAYTTQTGYYMRIGKRYWFDFTLIFTPTAGTGTGDGQIGGLPNISTATELVRFAAQVPQSVSWPAGTTQMVLSSVSAASHCLIHSVGDGTSQQAWGLTQFPDATIRTIRAQGTYEIA